MLIDFLFRLLARLPLAWLHCLGGWAGWLLYACSPSYRCRLRANLARAMGDAPRALLRQAIAEAGRQALELPWVWLRPLDAVLAKVRAVHGQEVVEAARRDGAGILFFAPHLGCFEIAGHYCAHVGRAPMVAMYRPPRYRPLEPLMRAGRVRGGMTIAPADLSGVRQLLKTLRARSMAGILPDQTPRAGEGVWTDFFGRPAWTMTLGMRLAEVRDVRVIYTWAERLPRGRGYIMHFALPAEIYAGNLAERCAAMNRDIERVIRRCPQQYLWGYNRYKRPRRADGETAEEGGTEADDGRANDAGETGK
ncbi:MAG: lysophospholipid acyltransferase family protein [Azoarcus sp.]|nr:lysophospholipid acyltransferase family protein [Azoarcus sp.]